MYLLTHSLSPVLVLVVVMGSVLLSLAVTVSHCVSCCHCLLLSLSLTMSLAVCHWLSLAHSLILSHWLILWFSHTVSLIVSHCLWFGMTRLSTPVDWIWFQSEQLRQFISNWFSCSDWIPFSFWSACLLSWAVLSCAVWIRKKGSWLLWKTQET